MRPFALRRSFPRPSLWTVVATVIASVVLLPIVTVLAHVFIPDGGSWRHLADTVLGDYIGNSLSLMLGVTLGAGGIGIATAWLTSMYRFPGRGVFVWALLLPLAFPAYILAYTYTGMLEPAGPVQSWIRETFGLAYGEYWFPEVRSLGGAVVMLSLVFYPYVYLLARAAFLEQSVCALEASRTLGYGPWRSFFFVALPLARPAIVVGVSLALMETLADFGTVDYFGISTFTTGIFRTWYGLYDEVAAAQLAALLMTFVFVLLGLEHWSRRRMRFHHATNRYRALPQRRLPPLAAWGAAAVCFLPVLFGFLLPFVQLGIWVEQTWERTVDERFFTLARNSFVLAAVAAVISLGVALLLSYGKRLHPTPWLKGLVRLAGMGYAIPGMVIAVGVLIPFGWIDNTIDAWARAYFPEGTGLLLSGTLFMLLFAYLVRFLTVSLQSVEAGLSRIKPSMEEAAWSLGASRGETLRRVHLPLMRGTLLTASLIVFVEVLKELPATLVLRPFNFNTLAVRAYELASDEQLADAATAALTIVVVSIVPVVLLSMTISHARPGHRDRKAA